MPMVVVAWLGGGGRNDLAMGDYAASFDGNYHMDPDPYPRTYERAQFEQYASVSPIYMS